jgi:hypothetical protein
METINSNKTDSNKTDSNKTDLKQSKATNIKKQKQKN